MSSLGKRLIALRKQNGFSQSYLAQQVGVSYAQIGRYETKGSQPPAEVLKKLANVLDTSVDFLINGDTDEKAKSALRDDELLRQFKAVEQMTDDDKNTIKSLIDAFITKGKLKKLAL